MTDSQPLHKPVMGAVWMVLAGATFAIVNTIIQHLGMNLHLSSTTAVFIQYGFALVFILPFFRQTNIKQALSSKHRKLHFVRILVSIIGIQFWTFSLTHVPIWQGIALLMTSPLFATIGSGIFLKEEVTKQRWGATIVGFIGAMIILAPWSDDFTLYSFCPILAAMFWAAASLMAKYSLSDDSPLTVVAYMLVLMLPVNLLFSVSSFDFPSTQTVWLLLLVSGALTAFAQWSVVKAYSVAQASYIQPFDHVKLPLNVLAGFIVFGYVPPGYLWIGAFLIIASISFITFYEKNKQMKTVYKAT